MNVEIRSATAEEMGEMGILGGYVYGGSFGDGPDNTIATANSPEWSLCGFIDGELASMFSNIPFTMRAQGNPMKLAGVSTIGTQPEFRRRGLVRRIHTEAFARMREAGQPMAALWASQAAIYQRYGYAIASMQRRYTVDTADIGFFDRNEGSYDVRRVAADDAYDVAKKLYIEFINDRMCYLHRARVLWMQNALEPNDADGPIWTAVAYDSAGTPKGYVIYTLRAGKVDHRARGQELRIRDLVWLDQEAYRSIWSFIKSHDLVGRVFWHAAPSTTRLRALRRTADAAHRRRRRHLVPDGRHSRRARRPGLPSRRHARHHHRRRRHRRLEQRPLAPRRLTSRRRSTPDRHPPRRHHTRTQSTDVALHGLPHRAADAGLGFRRRQRRCGEPGDAAI